MSISVLQAVLDAITGALDPHTQIADHPNVKFAQMQRLQWVQRAERAEQERDELRVTEQEILDSTTEWADKACDAEAQCAALRVALERLCHEWDIEAETCHSGPASNQLTWCAEELRALFQSASQLATDRQR